VSHSSVIENITKSVFHGVALTPTQEQRRYGLLKYVLLLFRHEEEVY